MLKVLVFGASGNLGKEIVLNAINQGFEVTAAVRNTKKLENLKPEKLSLKVFDIKQPSTISGICNGFDIVISALGKSVSPFEFSKPSFNDVDLKINSLILEQAKNSKVKKFIYVSAFQSEKYPKLEYFRVHEAFAKRVINSGIDYSIIKPVALFSAFLDMIKMAKYKTMVNIGSGEYKTNPISEIDLAEIIIKAIPSKNTIIEAGGVEVFTRKELLKIIQLAVNKTTKLWNVPIGLVKFNLLFLRIINKNTFDKLDFILTVMNHDTIAPRLGNSKFDDYIKSKT